MLAFNFIIEKKWARTQESNWNNLFELSVWVLVLNHMIKIMNELDIKECWSAHMFHQR